MKEVSHDQLKRFNVNLTLRRLQPPLKKKKKKNLLTRVFAHFNLSVRHSVEIASDER